MYYAWVLGRFFYDILLYIYNKLNLEPLFFSILYTSKYNDDKFLARFISRVNVFFNYDDKAYLRLNKKFPRIFFFKLYFNKKNYSNINLKFLVKQYTFFKKYLNRSFNLLFFKRFANLNLFFIFLIIQNIFFIKYYNLLSQLYYFNQSKNNLVKFNLVFFIFLKNANKFYVILDFKKFSDWYKLCFGNLKLDKKIKMLFWYKRLYKQFKIEKYAYFYKIYPKYADNYFYSKLGKRLKELFFTYKYRYMFILKISNLHSFKFKLSSKFKIKEFLQKSPIRFLDSSVNKHISLKNLNNFNFFFLRKNRIFNKSRYSRNRQLYRTGVYWCLWLNIIIVYGLFFLFYRFTFNFGYVWLGVLILMLSMIISKVIKYNFYNIFKILTEFYQLFKWFGYIFFEILVLIKNLFYKFVFKLNIYKNMNSYFSSNFFISSLFFNKNILSFRLIKFVINIFKKWDLWIFKFLWQSMKEKDNSFLRYKTVIHFFKQLSKIHLMV